MDAISRDKRRGQRIVETDSRRPQWLRDLPARVRNAVPARGYRATPAGRRVLGALADGCFSPRTRMIAAQLQTGSATIESCAMRVRLTKSFHFEAAHDL